MNASTDSVGGDPSTHASWHLAPEAVLEELLLGAGVALRRRAQWAHGSGDRAGSPTKRGDSCGINVADGRVLVSSTRPGARQSRHILVLALPPRGQPAQGAP